MVRLRRGVLDAGARVAVSDAVGGRGGFAVGMVLVMHAGDGVLLFVGWECIGVASVLLVG